jgi:hypothetical protein
MTHARMWVGTEVVGLLGLSASVEASHNGGGVSTSLTPRSQSSGFWNRRAACGLLTITLRHFGELRWGHHRHHHLRYDVLSRGSTVCA